MLKIQGAAVLFWEKLLLLTFRREGLVKASRCLSRGQYVGHGLVSLSLLSTGIHIPVTSVSTER